MDRADRLIRLEILAGQCQVRLIARIKLKGAVGLALNDLLSV